MGYIFKQTRWVKQETINCDHPEVVKIWEWGSMGTVPGTPMKNHLSIMLRNGDSKDFSCEVGEDLSYPFEKVIAEAEEYLLTIK